MVFLSVINFIRNKGPDEFWRKRKIFKIAAHYMNRRRNCYSITIKAVQQGLKFATRGRQLKKQQISALWDQRLNAACEQHEFNFKMLKEGLARSDILLDRKSLQHLAIWEPRTFKSLINIALARTKADGLYHVKDLEFPSGVYTRGMIK